MMATAGKHVDWIIRPTGHGATYRGPAYIYLGPFKTWLESLPDQRPLTWCSPSLWGDETDLGGSGAGCTIRGGDGQA